MDRSDNFRVGQRAVGIAREGAAAYQRLSGMHVPEADYSRTVVSRHAVDQVAGAYNALPDFDRKALPAFHAMREEVGRQFDHMTRPPSRGGMGINVEVKREDPYPKIADMFHDVENGHIDVLSTAQTGGHPVFSNDENDMFRATHDVFGHTATGRGVDRHGEEAAYQKHSSMFSPLARQALASETRGQNHAMIAAGGQFQEQKVAVLPQEMRRTSFVRPRTPQENRDAVLQARQFHNDQLGTP